MARLRDAKGRDVAFTRVPNQVIRSRLLDVYEKAVFACLASCSPSYPSLSTIMDWSGIRKRNTVVRCLKKLEANRLIERYKVGDRIYYVTAWDDDASKLPHGAKLVTYSYRGGNPKLPELVTQGYPKKNKEKEQRKIASATLENGGKKPVKERTFIDIMEHIQKKRDAQ